MVDQLSKLAHNGLLFQIIGESWSSIIPFKQKYIDFNQFYRNQPFSNHHQPPLHHLFTTFSPPGSTTDPTPGPVNCQRPPRSAAAPGASAVAGSPLGPTCRRAQYV